MTNTKRLIPVQYQRGLKIVLFFVFFLCLASAWGGRAFFCNAILRQFFLPAIQRQLPGLQLQFQGLETNLYSRLQVKQLSLDYCQDGDCLRLRAPSITLSYSLAGLLPWREANSWLRHLAIDIQGASLSADLLASNSPSAPTTPRLLPLIATPAINARDCSVVLKVHGATISGQGLAMFAPPFEPNGSNPYAVKLTAETLSVSGGAWPPQQGTLAVTLAYQNGRLQVPALFFQDALLLDDGVLETDSQGLRFAMRLHLLQSQGLVQGSMNQQAVALSFHLAEGDLNELAKVAGGSAQSPLVSDGSGPRISGHIQTDGEIMMDTGKPESLAGKVTAKVSDGSWNGIPLDLLEVSARAADQVLTIENAKLLIGQNQLTVENGVMPIPDLKKQAWLSVLAASRATAQIRLTAPAALPPVWTTPFLSNWQALGLAAASAELTLRDGQLLAPQAEISGQAGRVWVKDGKLDLTGDLSDWLEVPWSLSWQAELADAAIVHHFYEDWPATGGKAQGQGSFSGTLNQPHLPFSATFTGSSLYGVPLAKVTGQVEWTKDHLALDVMANNRERDQLTYRGTIDIDKGELLPTNVSTTLADMQPYLPKSLIGETTMSGPLAGTASLAGIFPDLTGTVAASGDWTIEGTKLSGAKLDAGFNGRKWSANRLSGAIDDAVTVKATGRFEPDQEWRRTAVDFDALALSYQDQELQLTTPGGLTVSSNSVTVRSPLSFAGKPGRFRLEGNKPGGAGHLTLVGEELRDTGLLRQLSGKDIGFSGMGFTLDMDGALSHPDWRWQGNVRGLAVGGEALAMNGVFDLAYDDQGLRFTQCILESDDQSINLSGRLPLSVKNRQWVFLPKPMEFKAKVVLPEGGILPQLFPEWLAASGDVHADLTLTGAWDQPLGQIQFSASGLTPGPRLAALPPGPFDAQGVFKVEKEQVAIADFELSSPGLTLQMAGGISQLPFAALIDAPPGPLPGQLEVSGRYAMPALDWLPTKVTGLRRTAGTANGTFALSGPLSRPEVRAEISLKNGAARGSDSLLVFRDIALNATLDHEQVTVKSLSGTMGGSPVQGTGTIKAVFAEAPEFGLKVTGKDLLLYRADGMKIRADTNLEVSGTTKVPALTGEVMLTDSRITKRVDWLSFLRPGTSHNGDVAFRLFSFQDAPLKDTRLDLRIKTAQPVIIANNVFKGEVRPDLVLAGSGEVPYLTGVIYSDSGQVTLPSGRLDLENGLIRFTDDAPDRPQLEFQATGRMMAYDITAQVRGAYDEPEVTLSSVPALASEDLLMLLLTGRRPVNEGQTNTNVSTVAVYLGRGLLSRLFGEKAAQSLLLDRLELDVGRAVTQQGEPTVDARVKLADGVWKSDTTYYLTGEKDIWDYYNGGVRAVFRFR